MTFTNETMSLLLIPIELARATLAVARMPRKITTSAVRRDLAVECLQGAAGGGERAGEGEDEVGEMLDLVLEPRAGDRLGEEDADQVDFGDDLGEEPLDEQPQLVLCAGDAAEVFFEPGSTARSTPRRRWP